MKRSPLLVVVDDNPANAEIIATVGAMCGYEVRRFASGVELVSASAERTPDAMVLDIVMPNMDGLELMDWIAEHQRRAQLILVSGFGERYLRMARELAEAKGLTVAAAIKKPFAIADLSEVLRGIRPDN